MTRASPLAAGALPGYNLVNNYNYHNIYCYPLFWLVKNGHLIVLTCISFFDEPQFVFMRGGVIHGRTLFCDTVQCFYEEKWTVGNYLNFT